MLEDGSTICGGILNPLDLNGQQAKAVAFNENDFDPPADRTPLVIDKQRSAILDMLKRENVIIIKGFTGCGKTKCLNSYWMNVMQEKLHATLLLLNQGVLQPSTLPKGSARKEI